ncbi:TetR/AcrR family transcriptional regulator [Dietzia psychralcaliphila]|uniref:TetR family transcriptional regulator n=1 Tax=Dietzia psychralcaliphila TaxID=139021 RepID=A0AAD0NNJ9_9ACTN|nr:TetR/AcrR family transcriptional regulator [Dietzia psychralcaliphila]AWH96027.1 TetR family transcriptional regulator [Dietzia psychralcaliphila]PTM90934.1 TetR family transcriptional regulator [Dietzia psychralcaliphila]
MAERERTQGAGETTDRRTRARGRESRRKITEAAATVAGERGYEGTTIAQVSKVSGLPASSIYWHFADKDALLAAVVEESIELWLGQVTRGEGESLEERVTELCLGVARTFRESPDFLRLVLMLALERRPVEPVAREIYLRLRGEAIERIAAELEKVRPGLAGADARLLATYALGGGDGIFLASLTGDADVAALFRLHAEAIVHLVEQAEAAGS